MSDDLLCDRWRNVSLRKARSKALHWSSQDYVYHGPTGEFTGRDAIKDLWATFLTGFPDMHSTIDRLVAEGDRVVMRWTIRGTHTGEFNGIPPTGKSVTVPILEELRIADGALAEAWDSFDQLGLLQQIDSEQTSGDQ